MIINIAKRPTSNVLNFDNVDDLLKYMSTVAF